LGALTARAENKNRLSAIRRNLDSRQPFSGLRFTQEPRLKEGSKSDRIDARKLAELLRDNQLHAVLMFRLTPTTDKGTAEEFHASFDLCMYRPYGLPKPKR
jgi:hypothetical protein